MTMSRASQARPPQLPAPLPIRWVLILSLSAGLGVLVGWIERPALGILVAIVTLKVLHMIIASR